MRVLALQLKRIGDLVLTAPHALPAMPAAPKVSDKATLVSANYGFLYNVVCTRSRAHTRNDS